MGEEFYIDQTKILSCQIKYPEFVPNTPQFQIINAKSYALVLQKKEYCIDTLYPAALDSYLLESHGLPYEMVIDTTVTMNNPKIISFYQDEYTYTGGAHGTTVRTGSTFDAKTGKEKSLEDFVKDKIGYKDCIINTVIKQIEQSGNESDYFEDYKTLIKGTFNPDNFYITDQGIVVFFGLYDIAPYVSGIKTFTIPFDSC